MEHSNIVFPFPTNVDYNVQQLQHCALSERQ